MVWLVRAATDRNPQSLGGGGCQSDIYTDIPMARLLPCTLLLRQFLQCIPDHPQHEFNKNRGLPSVIRNLKHPVILFLILMHQCLNRQPGKNGLPLLENE